MTNTPAQLAIVGASVRAAAQSARRAEQSVWGADLFADEDLKACAETTRIERYPIGLLPALSAAPQVPWLYTGALENYPGLIKRLATVRPLLGNGAETLRAVRDPFRLADELHAAGIAFPETYLPKQQTGAEPVISSDQLHSARWLHKPLRSAAGKHICFQSQQTLSAGMNRKRRNPTVVQQYIPGSPCSAVYVGAGGKASFLGLTKQLIGCAELRAEGFTYSGSLGPVPLAPAEHSELLHIGQSLADRFSLIGLFGVDLMQTAATANEPAKFVVIEVNPRYTASVELLERALGYAAIRWHLAACTSGKLPTMSEIAAYETNRWHAKGILFAREAAQFHPQIAEFVCLRNANSACPQVADIPAIGTSLLPGHPVVTLFAESSTETLAKQGLFHAATEFEAMLYQSDGEVNPESSTH